MEYLPARGWKRVLVLAAYILIGAALAFIALRWLLAPALPFLAAWAVAAIVRKITAFLSAIKFPLAAHIPERLMSVILVCGLSALLGLAVTSLAMLVINGINGLRESAVNETEAILGDIERFLRSIAEWLRLPEGLGNGYLHEIAAAFVKNTVSAIAARVPGFLGSVITVLPGVIMFAVVTFIASLYLSADYKKLGAAIWARIPDRARNFIGGAGRRISQTMGKFLKAYAIIAFITFSELLVGLTILRVDYAVLFSMLIALIDALPFIGSGAALIPWAAVMLLRGDLYKGIGLIVIYIVIQLVRQFVEPRVVGKVSGLHPLAALAAMYCGLKLFGVLGMFAFPFAAAIACGLLQEGERGDGETVAF